MSVQTMAAVWKGSRHSGSALLMMLAIGDFSDDKGIAFPSVATLAEKTRMKPRNAHYLLNELQLSGELLIKVGAGRHGTNLYQIVLSRLEGVQPVAGVHRSAGVQGAAGVHHSAQGGALQCADPLHPSAPEPSLNHQEPPVPSPSRRSAPKAPRCPIAEIVDLFHDKLPELPAVKLLDAKGRKDKVTDFWKWVFSSRKSDGSKRASTSEEALAWIAAYFERARSNDFIMGRSARSAGHEDWRAGFDYVISDKGRLQVIERTEVAA